jgi:hypothetical protein
MNGQAAFSTACEVRFWYGFQPWSMGNRRAFWEYSKRRDRQRRQGANPIEPTDGIGSVLFLIVCIAFPPLLLLRLIFGDKDPDSVTLTTKFGTPWPWISPTTVTATGVAPE